MTKSLLLTYENVNIVWGRQSWLFILKIYVIIIVLSHCVFFFINVWTALRLAWSCRTYGNVQFWRFRFYVYVCFFFYYRNYSVTFLLPCSQWFENCIAVFISHLVRVSLRYFNKWFSTWLILYRSTPSG